MRADTWTGPGPENRVIEIDPDAETLAQRLDAIRALGLSLDAVDVELDAMADGALPDDDRLESDARLEHFHETAQALAAEIVALERLGADGGDDGFPGGFAQLSTYCSLFEFRAGRAGSAAGG